MSLKECNIKASSLAESVIAMAIMAICLVVVTSVMSSVVSNTAPIALYDGRQAVKKWAQETRAKQIFTEESREGEGYTIVKDITRLGDGTVSVSFALKLAGTTEIQEYIMYEK